MEERGSHTAQQNLTDQHPQTELLGRLGAVPQ